MTASPFFVSCELREGETARTALEWTAWIVLTELQQTRSRRERIAIIADALEGAMNGGIHIDSPSDVAAAPQVL